MEPLLRFSVSLLVFIALLKNCHAACGERKCYSNETLLSKLRITTTNISLDSEQNCTLSTTVDVAGETLLTGLTPGAIYEIFINCSNCCTIVTMKPEVVRNLTVTDASTSSVTLNWTAPEGNSSSYRVQWTGGNVSGTNTVTQKSVTISNLTAGVQYTITVTAVADDGVTDGQSSTVQRYTKPKKVRNLSVTDVSTSSVALNWTAPEGNSSSYRVQWTSGNVSGTNTVSETSVTISNLTAGVQYTITVTAVAYDGVTDGQSSTVQRYTKPEVVWNLTVSEFTTSSIYVMWTEPNGERSFYRVQWTNGTTNWMVNVSERKINVTELTAGVKYTVTVIAVAGDNKTESDTAETFHYTKPKLVRNLSVIDVSTSSVALNWTAPEGNSSFYRVQWTSGSASGTNTVSETSVTISNLTAGVQYTITVTAVAYDGITDGQSSTVHRYTILSISYSDDVEVSS
ncbi:receptor-type tyrosine-protein phosphatase eta [Toxotes jaculatrix]|uniref:receptor-type tyrosine-protein phosphatase eta n=1 Tax=Toxotes jaculatrix TaxID=941984 RepID=UPI001B3AC059|nr:receptor-type tyrosine-protein phosphatase eta [Toxotes jaculatrix]